MPSAALARRIGPHRARATGMALGAGVAVAVLAAVDPERGHYPACPTYALLGFDCPACGTMRGVHDLGRGRVLDALDHNLLLVAAVPFGAWLWWRWVRTALGQEPHPRTAPQWALPALVAIAVGFAVLRNLPFGALEWLAAT